MFLFYSFIFCFYSSLPSTFVYKFIFNVINYEKYLSFNIFDLSVEKNISLNDSTYSYLIKRDLFTIEDIWRLKIEITNLVSYKFHKSILLDKILSQNKIIINPKAAIINEPKVILSII